MRKRKRRYLIDRLATLPVKEMQIILSIIKT